MNTGVYDLDLGASRYEQVRIGAGKDLYLKGMAAYADSKDFPKGKDIIYNVTKNRGTPVEDTLKTIKPDIDNPFGANITAQRGAINIVNAEGDWDTWSTTMSSQFLSKQPSNLIKDRLDVTFNSI